MEQTVPEHASRKPARWRVMLGRIAVAVVIGGLVLGVAAATTRNRELRQAVWSAALIVYILSIALAFISLRFRPIVFCVGVGVLAVIVLPGLMRACCGGGESAAIGALREINIAQATYSASCASGGYAVDLADLARPPTGEASGFVTGAASNGVLKTDYVDYVVTLQREASADVHDVSSPASTCNKSVHQPASGYFASASPVKLKRGAINLGRYFATDTRGMIFFSTDGPLRNPIPADANVVW